MYESRGRVRVAGLFVSWFDRIMQMSPLGYSSVTKFIFSLGLLLLSVNPNSKRPNVKSWNVLWVKIKNGILVMLTFFLILNWQVLSRLLLKLLILKLLILKFLVYFINSHLSLSSVSTRSFAQLYCYIFFWQFSYFRLVIFCSQLAKYIYNFRFFRDVELDARGCLK